MANVYVNIDELKQIAQDMKTKSNNIIDNYQNQVESAITLGQEAIQISGLDTTQIKSSFNKIFTNLNTRINELADFLINNVANEYDDISLAITNSFNDSFATELAGLLGITVGTGSVSKSNKSTSSTSKTNTLADAVRSSIINTNKNYNPDAQTLKDDKQWANILNSQWGNVLKNGVTQGKNPKYNTPDLSNIEDMPR